MRISLPSREVRWWKKSRDEKILKILWATTGTWTSTGSNYRRMDVSMIWITILQTTFIQAVNIVMHGSNLFVADQMIVWKIYFYKWQRKLSRRSGTGSYYAWKYNRTRCSPWRSIISLQHYSLSGLTSIPYEIDEGEEEDREEGASGPAESEIELEKYH